uniref:ATP synthase F0 subunit 8 n=1 Tax=Pellia neesiana TaxID=70144 RepID=UPI00257E409A|nr:ATP synthase F0 subunit 8 [Pellia neesiana]WIA66962.1 ATP synthase F0 subunit 8 [Pellia neesiana]WIA67003.1 ATP synthase F0 subunit 8 [Pellia neesiana]WIA67044.1 ATP synthase F0 subunit 8 [Pellia neesiana]
MPQLDQFTYLTQFVWLCVFYITFYVLLYNDGLPKISRIIKLRKRLHLLVSSQQQKVGNESNDRVEQVVFKECFQASANYPYSSVSGASKWCKGMVQLANANKLQRMNKDYVCSLGEISVSQVIKKNAFSSTLMLSNSPRETANKIYVLRGQKRTLFLG